MKFTLKPQTAAERIGLAANLVPIPVAHTLLFSLLARVIYDATEAGVFEALAAHPATAAEIAAARCLDATALEAVLGALVAIGYLRHRAGRYSLPRSARKWLLQDSPASLYDQIRFTRSLWGWLDHLPEFLRSGHGIQYHDSFAPEQWDLYQRAMEAVARGNASEVAARTPLPRNATEMLDIGGAHGLYSVALCRRHPRLRATVLDLPAAVEAAAPLLARHGMGDRVRLEAGDALTADLGESRYDLVFVSSLMHHFSAHENRGLSRRAARALKPGGGFAIQEFVRPDPHHRADAVGSLLNVLFALSSTAGTWRLEDLKAWQAEAGLHAYKVMEFLTMPGFRQVVARRASSGSSWEPVLGEPRLGCGPDVRLRPPSVTLQGGVSGVAPRTMVSTCELP